MEPRIVRVSGATTPAEARENALDRYATAYEFFATKEQEHRGNGDLVKAEGAHRYALWVLRAYTAEQAT